MKLLLTGSSGFVGRNTLLGLLPDPNLSKILLPVRNPQKLEKQLAQEKALTHAEKIEIISSEAPLWSGLETMEVDYLIHSAGLLFGRTEAEFNNTNVMGTEELLKKIQAPKTLILSSQAASGPCKDNEWVKTEDSPNRPISFYGKSKLEMELGVQKNFKDRSVVILRPPMILGPRDSATLPLFKMAKSRLLFKPGLKPKSYSFIGVEDLVEAMRKVLFGGEPATGGVYFVAHPEVITDEMLLRGSAEAAQVKGALVRIPQVALKLVSKVIDQIPPLREAVPSLSGDRAQEVWPERWVVSSKKFSDTFQWNARQSLSEVLTDTYRWYLDQGVLN